MALHETTSDEDLLSLILAGDEDAFTALYRRRQTGIYRFAAQMSGSAAIAEDVVQEVFLTLIRSGHLFDPTRGAVSAFLFGIARNQVLRRIEKDRAFVELEGESGEGSSIGSDRPNPLDELTRDETIAAVRQAILSLPVHYREVVVLCELQEQSYIEAARLLDCAVGTVRSRLHRARSLLLEKLRMARAEGERRAVNAKCLV
jgi:RNA polymerase sigma-70 factor (ECF subfamily)